jgi:hypothetical protein
MTRLFLCAPVALALALGLGLGQAAHAECKLQQLTSIPISFVNNQPMVNGTINGKPARLRFTLNNRTWIWNSALKEYGLKRLLNYAKGIGFGPGGQTDLDGVFIAELKIGELVQKNTYYYLALDVNATDEAGLFGDDLFDNRNDIELDFAHNVVRVFKSPGCKDDDVVYWGGNYSVVERNAGGFLPFKLGGKPLNGSLSPGNEVTFVTLDGAKRAGVSLRAAGLLPMGMVAGGTLKPVDVSIANFPELVIGDEIIKNAPLAVGDIWVNDYFHRPDVVLGADFIRSHRIYIAAQQKKVYFSYVGGELFQDIYARLGAPDPRKPPKP